MLGKPGEKKGVSTALGGVGQGRKGSLAESRMRLHGK